MASKNQQKTSAQPSPQSLSRQLTYQILGPETLSEAEASFKRVEKIKVSDAQSSSFAQGLRAEIDRRIKELDEARKERTRPLDAVKKQLIEDYARPIDLLILCRRELDRQILAYDDQQRAIARAAQRKIDEENEREQRRLAKLAEKAEARGDEEKAESFRDRASSQVAAVVQPQVVQAAGTSFVETWSFEITDAKQVAPEFMEPDLVKIGKAVRSLHLDAQEIVGKGVRIFSNRGIQQRGK